MKSKKTSFEDLLVESMAEMQAINQPAVGSNATPSSIVNVPAPGVLSVAKNQLLPTEESEESQDDKIDNLYTNIKNILINKNSSKFEKINQLIKLLDDFKQIN